MGNGIMVKEEKNPLVTPNIFNQNNIYYAQDSMIYYDIEYKIEGNTYKDYCSIKCMEGFGRSSFGIDSSYTQSVIEYQFYDKDGNKFGGSETTGLVDNKINLWFHPPRINIYRPLQLSPYPYIKFPICDNCDWNWEFTFGRSWFLSSYKGNLDAATNLCNYKVDRDSLLMTDLGKLNTKVIVAHCKSEIGNTNAEFIFSEKFGMLEMNFYSLENMSYSFKRRFK